MLENRWDSHLGDKHLASKFGKMLGDCTLRTASAQGLCNELRLSSRRTLGLCDRSQSVRMLKSLTATKPRELLPSASSNNIVGQVGRSPQYARNDKADHCREFTE
jgi:hypothetical protein